MSDEDSRHQLKDQIDGLSAHDGDDSATNWEAALLAAKELRLDVAVLVTDGLPNVYGDPVQEGDDQAIAAAVTAANQLKQDGTRVTGVGIDLDEHRRAKSGKYHRPGRGEDYFVTDTAGLLRQLYEIVASSCGVPLAALPQPEPPDFPWTEVLLGALGVLALIGASRLRAAPKTRRREQPCPPRPAPVAVSPRTGASTIRTSPDNYAASDPTNRTPTPRRTDHDPPRTRYRPRHHLLVRRAPRRERAGHGPSQPGERPHHAVRRVLRGDRQRHGRQVRQERAEERARPRHRPHQAAHG